jgi:hypothetical protein
MNDFPWLVLAVIVIPIVLVCELFRRQPLPYPYHPSSVRRPDGLA